MSIKTNAEQIRDETITGANTATRVGGNLVEIADDLIVKQTAIDLNTAKSGITTDQSSAIVLNTAKTGISTGQASDIILNTAKVGISTGQSSEITANTAKVGITTDQATAIVDNTTGIALKSNLAGGNTISGNQTISAGKLEISSAGQVANTPVFKVSNCTIDSLGRMFLGEFAGNFTSANAGIALTGTPGTNATAIVVRVAASASGNAAATLQLWQSNNSTTFMAVRNTGEVLFNTNSNNGVDKIQNAGSISATTIKTASFTVATLPAPPLQGLGAIAHVTDALNPTYLGTLTGGGTVKCPVFYNGTAWVSS